MSNKYPNSVKEVAIKLADFKKNINLIYAFNGIGKTRLSVAYKDITKERNEDNHSGVYYNAYSEDLFNWDNDEGNDGANVQMLIQKSSLNKFHASLDEVILREKLAPYKPKFDFKFDFHVDRENGIKSVQFTLKDDESSKSNESEKSSVLENIPIKISRGEEQIFIWSFFLTLFEIEGWTGDKKQSTHFFIDDPVSSLDDHNIFVTISSLMDLIDEHFKNRKIIITTHHIGFFSILADWLTRGEKSSRYKDHINIYKLKNNNGILELVGPRKEVFLYHLELLRVLKEAIDEDEIYVYHFSLLRQVLENISSFLGVRNFSYVLKEIGITEAEQLAQIVNIMSHKTVFRYELREPVPDNKKDIIKMFDAIQNKYNFILHT